MIYTYDGDKIIEKFCEALGYPNVTHDGEMMYEDMFFTDKSRAIKEAKSNSDAEIEFYQRRIKETKANLEKLTADMTAAMSERHKLEKDYPEKHGR